MGSEDEMKAVDLARERVQELEQELVRIEERLRELDLQLEPCDHGEGQRALAELFHRRRELGNRLNSIFDSDVLRIVASILEPLRLYENFDQFVVAPVRESRGDHAVAEVACRLAMVLNYNCSQRRRVVARSGEYNSQVRDSRGIELDGNSMNRTNLAPPGAASCCASQLDEDALRRAAAIVLEYARADQTNHFCQWRATGNGTSNTHPHTFVNIGTQECHPAATVGGSHHSETVPEDPPAVGSWPLSGPILQVIAQAAADELRNAADNATDPRLKVFLKTITLISFVGAFAGIGMPCAGRSLSLVMFRMAATAIALGVIVTLVMDLEITVAFLIGVVAFIITVASLWQ